MRDPRIVSVAEIASFDTLIDVRSPAEYALDHIVGAINCPVLDDAERAAIGTLYKQVSPFDANKRGAALVARNIARHIEDSFLARERGWRPLVYCWRGGKRSGAMARILAEIGWPAAQIEGGYRAYRRTVMAQLGELAQALRYRVVCGATGSAKSRLLEALAARGAQVLDLEELACHRGSVLGDLPERAQPSQKFFDSLLWDALRRFDPRRVVFVEAESRKIGRLLLPEPLILAMRASPCVAIEAPLATRVDFLMQAYRHFFADPQALKDRLACLSGLHSKETLARWMAAIDGEDWPALVADLLQNHYDPAYRRATRKNFAQLARATTLSAPRLDAAALAALAQQLITETER